MTDEEKKKKTKVYLAILNGGQLRSEMTATVIPAMQKTKDIELIWENPAKTWANPISSNRNKIVKRFLETDCDYLLMIDDDVVPLHNPCELVSANKDIIGSPALVRSIGEVLVWTAYIPHSSGNGYSAVDLTGFDDMFDLLQVAIVGTGCILIKRKVLETLKAPFHSEFDEDGVQIYGTDFAFCRRATKAGFIVHTTTHRRCEHFKKVGLSEMDGWDTVDYFDRSNLKYNIPWGGKNILQKDWLFIKTILKGTNSKRILVFGAGLASLLMSEICEVVCYETVPDLIKDVESKCLENNNLIVKLWDGKTCPNPTELFPTKVDLVFVDGPIEIEKGGIGREEAVKIASQISDHVIVHDAGRVNIELNQRKYLRSIFKLIRRSGNHFGRCHYWGCRPKPVTLEDVKSELKSRRKAKK